jgi:hypothetical protein
VNKLLSSSDYLPFVLGSMSATGCCDASLRIAWETSTTSSLPLPDATPPASAVARLLENSAVGAPIRRCLVFACASAAVNLADRVVTGVEYFCDGTHVVYVLMLWFDWCCCVGVVGCVDCECVM